MPNDYDKILRENLDALLPFIARKLLGLDLSRTETLKDKIQVTLEREGDYFKKVLHDDQFEVIHLREIPKEIFLNSNVPEEVVLAILCDFGADQPERVIRIILQNLMKIVGRVPRLQRYQRQLHVLSRLRKLHPISLKEIKSMPIHYDIETDELYLAGLEKGLEKGIEQHRHETVVRMLKAGRFTDDEIAGFAGVPVEYVRQVRLEMNLFQ